MLTAYQEPPPPLLAGCGHGALIVWKRQTILPVAADSAYRTPRPPGRKPCVLTYTRPRSTIGAMPTNCSYWFVTRRVKRLARLADEVSLGNLDAGDFRTRSQDEIGVLTEALGRMKTSMVQAIKMLEG